MVRIYSLRPTPFYDNRISHHMMVVICSKNFHLVEMGLATPTAMGEQPNLDEFIRHLQAELELSESIVDPVEQEQRQWQIAASLQ